jgi:hypothetical protein
LHTLFSINDESVQITSVVAPSEMLVETIAAHGSSSATMDDDKWREQSELHIEFCLRERGDKAQELASTP